MYFRWMLVIIIKGEKMKTISINELPVSGKRDYEKYYSFEDLQTELRDYLADDTFPNYRTDMMFLVEKIVELQNRIIGLEKEN